MKVCKRCNQIVELETVTCPYCDAHEFNVSKIKACSLCGKINPKKNLICEQCGKSFSGVATEYAIATALSLSSDEKFSQEEKKPIVAAEKHISPKQAYVELKAEIETRSDADNYAYFIPSYDSNERPVVVMPKIRSELDKKVEVFFVMPTRENSNDLKMERVLPQPESVLDGRKKSATKARTSFPALFIFLLNLGMLLSFGFEMALEKMGFQIIAALFGYNEIGRTVLNQIRAKGMIGEIMSFMYLITLGIAVISFVIAAACISTKKTKGKKVLLIVFQSVLIALSIGIYLICPLILEMEFLNLQIGCIILLACSLIAFMSAILYEYKHETEPANKPSFPRYSQEEEREMEQLGSVESREPIAQQKNISGKQKEKDEKKRAKEEQKQKIREKKEKDKESNLSDYNFDLDSNDEFSGF